MSSVIGVAELDDSEMLIPVDVGRLQHARYVAVMMMMCVWARHRERHMLLLALVTFMVLISTQVCDCKDTTLYRMPRGNRR